MQQNDLFAKQLKSARQRLKLSQSQAAKEWGVPLKTLQQWEQAVAMPRGSTLLTLLPLLSAPASSTSTPKASGSSARRKPRGS